MRAPHLSVVIPSHNKRAILEPALDALARQDYPADLLEVVVVDTDRPTDDTALHLASRRDPFRLRSESISSDSGFHVGRARNRGIETATGEVVVFLDADVLATPALCRAHSTLVERAEPVVSLGYLYGYPHPPSFRTPEHMRPPPAAELLGALPRLVADDPRSWLDCREWAYALWPAFVGSPEPWRLCFSANFACPLALAREAGGFDERFLGWGLENQEFAYRLFRLGAEFHGNRAAAGAHYPHSLRTNLGDEFARNSRRFIHKHPQLTVECALWRMQTDMAEHPRWTQAEMEAVEQDVRQLVMTPPPVVSQASESTLRALFEILDRHKSDRPYGWFGLMPAEDALDRPRFHSVPFGGAQSEPALLGLYAPLEDADLAVIVIADYWRWLAPLTLRAVLVEMTRVAPAVVLLTTQADAPPLNVPGEQVELPGGLAYLVRR